MRTGVLFALLLLAACAHQLRSRDPQNWMEVQSEHFVLRTDLPEEDARKAIRDFELVRAALLAVGWHSARPAADRTQVVELASALELRDFARQGIEGFVMRDAFGEPLMVVSADRDVLDQHLVKHELTHVINAGFLVSRPRWVDEGIACYLETLRFDRRKSVVVTGEPSNERLAYLKQFGVRNFFSTISTGREFESMSAEQGYAFETVAWLLVHWFVDTQPEKFDAFVTRLARGENAWVAFSAVFPDLHEEQIEESMRAYSKKGGMRFFSSPMPAAWNGEVTARSVEQAEAHALRAELLHLAPGGGTPEERERMSQGEASLALAADAGNPLALQLLRDSNGDAAVAAHPDDWRAWLLFADRHRADLVSIEKAARLAPENAGVLYRLALAEQNASRPTEALRHAAHAAELAPGRPEVLDALAHVYAANGRCNEAQETERRALDAIPDSATTDLPVGLRQRLNDIILHCGEQSSLSTKVMVQPVVKSCAQPLPRAGSSKDTLTAEFTIGEDGSVSGVAVTGKASKALMAAFKRYVESCTYEIIVVEGKRQSLKTTLQIRAQPR